MATGGWDGPVRVFALVRTAAALAADPEIGRALGPDVVAAAALDADHLTAVEQEGLPQAQDVEELLASLAWPDSVDGAAIVLERIVVPPGVEEGLPDDQEQAVAALMAHPERQDVRIATGVLRSGESWCALRSRAHDDDASVASSPDAVPGLVAALAATLA